MMFQIALAAVASTILFPVLYDRFGTFGQILWSNAPASFVRIDTFASHEVKFADRIRSCEDVLLVESAGVAILACDAGRERWNTVMGFFVGGQVPSADIWIYDYAGGSDALNKVDLIDFRDGQNDFHTLGMAYDEGSSTLLVTNHRQDGAAIEMFKLDIEARNARHIRTIRHPLIHGPNSMVFVDNEKGNEFYVTNDHHFLQKDSHFLAQAETYIGAPGGTVVHVLLKDDGIVDATVVARVPFANGIEILNATTVVVASTSRAAVYFYSVTRDVASSVSSTKHPSPTLTYVSQIRLPYLVDNLSVSSDGVLLIAGHPHIPSLVQFGKSRYICNDADELAKADPKTRKYCETATAPSWASSWTEEGGVKHLYADLEYPTSCTATRDAKRKMGVITGLYAKGILVYKE